MAFYFLAVNGTTGATKRLSAPFTDTFATATASQVNFSVTGLTATGKVDVYVNGVLMEEGATEDYQRNVASNRIEFNVGQTVNARVRIRVWAI